MSENAFQIGAWPGAASLKDSIPEGWYMTSDAAMLVGRHKDTIENWRTNGTYKPSGYMHMGELVVWLYSDEDIVKMREIAASKRPGRKPKTEEGDE